MKIEVLGTGCPKCKVLAAHAAAAAEKLDLDCAIEKVTDITEIMNRGVLATPALVVNGEVKAAGKVPSVEEIEAMIA